MQNTQIIRKINTILKVKSSEESILFKLPYWESLKLRYNLDVMHIKKNICENPLRASFNIDGKIKDTYRATQDLKDMNVGKELWLHHNSSNYTMTLVIICQKKEKEKNFVQF